MSNLSEIQKAGGLSQLPLPAPLPLELFEPVPPELLEPEPLEPEPSAPPSVLEPASPDPLLPLVVPLLPFPASPSAASGRHPWEVDAVDDGALQSVSSCASTGQAVPRTRLIAAAHVQDLDVMRLSFGW
jgi:hypothetical protein